MEKILQPPEDYSTKWEIMPAASQFSKAKTYLLLNGRKTSGLWHNVELYWHRLREFTGNKKGLSHHDSLLKHMAPARSSVSPILSI